MPNLNALSIDDAQCCRARIWGAGASQVNSSLVQQDWPSQLQLPFDDAGLNPLALYLAAARGFC